MTAPAHPSGSGSLPALGGETGPVLVIADHAAVARRGLAWATGFAARGRLHRVRLVGPTPSHVESIVAEAVGLGATALLVAGGETARHAGQAVAARLGLPLAIETDAPPPSGR